MTLAALWIGQSLRANMSGESGLHVVLHHDLTLDAEQGRRIDKLEQDFSVHRRRIETEMRAANADLAAAITREHAYGPDVEKAIDRSHMAMGELQKATLQHVFAMRRVLRSDQTGRFDKAVAKALTSPPQD
ncbi:periplasmic heavy metal sensor [Novosphingobium resinovorum]|nr:periplasmic heavy metal sensor [Novosphingobium resinovorum]WJM26115.1 periplasmic heavy metal sensor [Novosphingobium resinovorum]